MIKIQKFPIAKQTKFFHGTKSEVTSELYDEACSKKDLCTYLNLFALLYQAKLNAGTLIKSVKEKQRSRRIGCVQNKVGINFFLKINVFCEFWSNYNFQRNKFYLIPQPLH